MGWLELLDEVFELETEEKMVRACFVNARERALAIKEALTFDIIEHNIEIIL